jgi:hypothetical protein
LRDTLTAEEKKYNSPIFCYKTAEKTRTAYFRVLSSWNMEFRRMEREKHLTSDVLQKSEKERSPFPMKLNLSSAPFLTKLRKKPE